MIVMEVKMAAKLKIFLIVFISNAVVHGQQCGKEFQQFHDCLDYQKHIYGPNRTQLMQETGLCFTKNGCKSPKFLDDSNVKKNQLNDINLDKIKKCNQQIESKAHFMIEECVQKDLTDFTFPKTSKYKDSDEHSQIKSTFSKQMKQLCTRNAFIQTKKCLQTLLNTTLTVSQIKMCKAKEKCFAQMAPVCQRQFEMSKKLICNCADETLKPKSDHFEQEYFQCIGKNDTISNVQNEEKVVVFACQTDDECVKILNKK